MHPGRKVVALARRIARTEPPIRTPCFEDLPFLRGPHGQMRTRDEKACRLIEERFDLPRPKLLVVLTTHARSSAAERILARLAEAVRHSGLLAREVVTLVFEDPSPADYGPVWAQAVHDWRGRLHWFSAIRHLGKQEYYRSYQAAFFAAQRIHSPLTLFIQDDLDFEKSMLGRALDLFERLKSRDNVDAAPQVLNLYAADDDEPNGRWVDLPRRDVLNLPARQTQWFDLAAYLIDEASLAALDYDVIPIGPGRWAEDPHLSSGVGRQLTRRLKAKARIYQCYPPLVFHGSEPSVMNPEARSNRPLDNRNLRIDEKPA